jgi:acyl-coenzyme A synthetase/AMP-(fatty) acid ligase
MLRAAPAAASRPPHDRCRRRRQRLRLPGPQALGITINEFYGQTECNLVLGSCAAIGVSRAGAIGKVVPGHRVAIIDAGGRPADPASGQIAVRRPDPVFSATSIRGHGREASATGCGPATGR